MNIELENSEIDRIAQRVVQFLLPKLPEHPHQDDNLMTVPQLAEYLQVKEQWIYDRVKNKEIPHTKMGDRLLRFKKREIDKWIGGHTIPALSPYSGALKAINPGKGARG